MIIKSCNSLEGIEMKPIDLPSLPMNKLSQENNIHHKEIMITDQNLLSKMYLSPKNEDDKKSINRFYNKYYREIG
jgi:hypothetical protein